VEKKKNLEEVGDIYYGMELVIMKEVKYVCFITNIYGP
jgi:hypothetical protein